ncbi:MAG: DUF5717 family protein [Defluviitaleaceae bacterium]|nr:DUF5717 family protein [Defluviitaleaceae bacterium]MCL2274882.1 DUF5717 family protein [Defluviitaleaceae bacterium]
MNINRIIERLEARHERRPTAKSAIALAMRCWLAYALSPDEDMGRAYLQKANHISVTALRRNETYLPLLTLAGFISIEINHFDGANELLDKAMGYKSFLKAGEPKFYGELCFLFAYLEIRQNRVRSARKHWKNLQEIAATPAQRVMLGRLHLAMGEHSDAYALLADAFAEGIRSPFLYEALYHYYLTAAAIPNGKPLLPTLCYAASRGADIVDICTSAGTALSAAIEKDIVNGEKLYTISRHHPLLRDICAYRIRNYDHSPEAYALYQTAERKQVYMPGLYPHLIQAAYENDADTISHYPMAQFLQTAEPDTSLAVYVYHLLLTDGALSDLLPEHTNKILQLAARCLEQKIEGRTANSLYYYYWARCLNMGVTNAQLSYAESIIENELTRFELKAAPDSGVHFVYVTDEAKRGMDVYEMPEDGTLIIEAAGESINYTCLGAGQRSVLNVALTIRRRVGGANETAYQYFFSKGDRRFYLLRTLADFYLENPNEEAVEVYENLLSQKNIAKQYRMRLRLAIGQIYFDAGKYAQALENYMGVDENTPELPERLLQIYLHTHDYEQAATLISRRHTRIPNHVLLQAFAVLLPNEDTHPQLASAAYAMLSYEGLHEMYDELLAIALAHFPFSRGELIDLSAQNNNPALDKRILESSLWMATIDADAQRAFVRLKDNADASALIAPFIQLCTYHMLTTGFRPEYDTLDVLEKHYTKVDPSDNILALALGQVYLRHNLSTFHSDRIIKEAIATQEQNGILLPAFKEYKPAQLPFIEKHQPFLYKGLPNKEVYLYYKFDPEGPYHAKPMEYLRFGLYLTCLPLFYNEEISYYFSEELPTGSITTREITHKNTTPYIHKDAVEDDTFFAINNAIILEQMFKHDQVETLINGLVKDVLPVRSALM